MGKVTGKDVGFDKVASRRLARYGCISKRRNMFGDDDLLTIGWRAYQIHDFHESFLWDLREGHIDRL